MAAGSVVVGAQAGKAIAPKRNNAARLFGYDVFLSFALGAPPRGTQGYASDLARRLRERDFTVFFSEDEAAPGGQLDSTLLEALYRSHALVVIANRGTLESPGWVRKEVEAFRGRHPGDPSFRSMSMARSRTLPWPSKRKNGCSSKAKSGWTSRTTRSRTASRVMIWSKGWHWRLQGADRTSSGAG